MTVRLQFPTAYPSRLHGLNMFFFKSDLFRFPNSFYGVSKVEFLGAKQNKKQKNLLRDFVDAGKVITGLLHS